MSAPITLAEPIPVGQEEVIGLTLLRYISELQRQAANAEALRLQLSRAKELLLQALAGLQLSATYLASRSLHDTESGVMREHALKEQMERISGLTEFLKEVGEEGK